MIIDQLALYKIMDVMIEIDLLKGRYNWSQVRESMMKRIPDTPVDMLEQFLGKK